MPEFLPILSQDIEGKRNCDGRNDRRNDSPVGEIIKKSLVAPPLPPGTKVALFTLNSISNVVKLANCAEIV